MNSLEEQPVYLLGQDCKMLAGWYYFVAFWLFQWIHL